MGRGSQNPSCLRSKGSCRGGEHHQAIAGPLKSWVCLIWAAKGVDFCRGSQQFITLPQNTPEKASGCPFVGLSGCNDGHPAEHLEISSPGQPEPTLQLNLCSHSSMRGQEFAFRSGLQLLASAGHGLGTQMALSLNLKCPSLLLFSFHAILPSFVCDLWNSKQLFLAQLAKRYNFNFPLDLCVFVDFRIPKL